MVAVPDMRRKPILLLALFLLVAPLSAAAQDDEYPVRPDAPQGITPEQLIQRFAAKEKEFKEARENYTFRQSVKVQTLDGNSVDGEFQQVVDVTFDNRGRRVESVVFAPQSTLRRIGMSQEDFDDIEKRLPFVLTTDEISEYNLLYVGQQQVDELDTYVFDVAPKTLEKGKRYFEGRIWVDNQDFQIVKTYGKNVPDYRKKNEENLFPKFVTYREQIDGKYWFPTYTRADDVLKFTSGDVRIRIVVRYTEYKRFGTKTRITYEGQELEKVPAKPAEEQKKPQ
jgi:hypothetical protein